MVSRERVAWNLRRLRVLRGISQEALAVDAEVDRSYVGRLERAAENPTVNLLDRLAVALNSDVSEFFRSPRSGEAAPIPLRSGRKVAAKPRSSRKA
jgi:transcriptional regulator with XRE-family HTH domain